MASGGPGKIPRPGSPFRRVSDKPAKSGLARQILRSLLGQLAGQKTCGLTDLDHVAIRIAHIAADLGTSIDWRRNKFCAALAPFLVAGVDVSDPQIQEDRRRVVGLIIDYRDAGFVGRGPTTRIHDDPAVGELHHARVLLYHYLPAQDARIEIA